MTEIGRVYSKLWEKEKEKWRKSDEFNGRGKKKKNRLACLCAWLWPAKPRFFVSFLSLYIALWFWSKMCVLDWNVHMLASSCCHWGRFLWGPQVSPGICADLCVPLVHQATKCSLMTLWVGSVMSDSFCNPMDCSQPGSSVHGISQARALEWDCHFFLQGIFPTQGSNLGVLHCRQILYHLSHQKSPWNLGSWLKNGKKKKKGHWRAKCNKWRKRWFLDN